MKNIQKENVWLLVIAIAFVVCAWWGSVQESNAQNRETSAPPETTAPQGEQLALERIDINTKYQDGVRCEYYLDPVTQIVYVVFGSYDHSGITTMLHPETGKPMLLQDFQELYADYLIPEETEAPAP